MKEYVVYNRRLKEYLYQLGFNYRKEEVGHDMTYMFKDSEPLRKAIDFYTNFKNTYRNGLN